MQRRKFLKNTSLTGLSMAGFLSALGNEKSKEEFKIIDGINHDWEEATIESLQSKLQSGEVSSVDLVTWYTNRIKVLDQTGPGLNSVIELNPDAESIARMADTERKEGVIRGPLHGIPILIKENIDTADKMMTTAGSLALAGNIASLDAHIVEKLRKAGAILLGKTNLSEFANFRSTRSTSGWSSRGGQTKNPYALNRNTSGSSSGTGAAVSANLCAIGIGTETDGSIVSPASINGIVGIKPTVGLWSRSGIIPISSTQDTAGPMCRTVKDAAILLSVLSGPDSRDHLTQKASVFAEKDYSQYCLTNGLKGKRLGVEKSFLQGNPDVVDLYKSNIQLLKKQGAIIVEIELLKNIQPLFQAEYLVLQYEFKDGINKYLKTANAQVKTLDEIIAFNKSNAPLAMPFFKQELLELCNAKQGLADTIYKQALARSLSSRKIMEGLLKSFRLDAFCGTTSGLAWCIDQVNGDYDTGFSFSSPAAMAGFPHITVPMGLVKGLPIGLSFCAGPYSERHLISMAYSFEQASTKRVKPDYKPFI